MEMSQLYCGGCRTLQMYARGATSVRCSCCYTINLVPGTIYFSIARFGKHISSIFILLYWMLIC